MKTAFLLFLLAFAIQLSAQDFKTQPGYRFSNEDIHQMLVHKSKTQKTKAIVALSAGAVMTVTGIYIAQKNGPIISGAGGYYTVRDNPNGQIGALIGVAGILTTISSIPFFISSAKAKKQAALVLKDESTSYLGKPVAVPSLSLRINF